jgi:hypothetical protein
MPAGGDALSGYVIDVGLLEVATWLSVEVSGA